MSDRISELGEAREHIDPRWDAVRAARVLDGVHARLRARKRRQIAAVGLAAAALLVLSLGVGIRHGQRATEGQEARAPSPSATVAAASSSRVLHYRDGSSATTAAPGTELRVDEATPTSMITALERGAAVFDIVPDPSREFRVKIEAVTLTVLGTRFLVERGEHAVAVSVEQGRVRVDAPGASTILTPGQRGEWPLAAPEPPPEPAPGPSAEGARPAAPAESWRALARKGKNREAYDLMKGLKASQARDAEELLAAADVARLAGHGGEAVPFLERVLSEFRGDPRAPLAAFALGRIYLASRPAEAAARFAQARSLSPGGSLAEDALAREVEAWSRAGNKARARAGAEEYLKRYPRGARADQIRSLGGL